MVQKGSYGVPVQEPLVYTTNDPITIPGLSGSSDQLPVRPNQCDDEFDSMLSGYWSALGALQTLDANVTPSHLHLYRSSNDSFEVNGVYRSIPTMPFTITAKLTDARHIQNYAGYGLILTEAAPGKFLLYAKTYVNLSCYLSRTLWASRTSRTSYSDWVGHWLYRYLRFIVASSSDIICQVSEGGLVWTTTHASYDPGFTVANVGLGMTSNDNGSVPLEAYFDWIRFTQP
jgi:hypothetical protein